MGKKSRIWSHEGVWWFGRWELDGFRYTKTVLEEEEDFDVLPLDTR